MSIFSFLKPIATTLLGKTVRKGIKAGVGSVAKGIKSAGSKVVKGVKSTSRGGGQAFEGLKEIPKQLPPASALISMAKSAGIRTTSDRLKTVISAAYKLGKGKAQKAQAAQLIAKIGEQTKNVRNLKEMSRVLNKVKTNTEAERSVLQSIKKGMGRLLKDAGNSGVDVAKETAIDYAVGRGIQIGAGALLSGGVTTGAVVVGNKISK